jgi:hypothetical protein
VCNWRTNQKSTWDKILAGAFSKQQKSNQGILFTLSPLVARACQQLSVLVPTHFFSPFFNDTTQRITSPLHLIS